MNKYANGVEVISKKVHNIYKKERKTRKQKGNLRDEYEKNNRY